MKTNPTCQAIEHLLYLTEDEIQSQELLLLNAHCSNCPECSKIRKDFLTIRQLTLQSKQTLTDYPDFREAIEILIDQSPGALATDHLYTTNQIWRTALSFIRYVSGIAAIALIFLFASEQTITVRKINRLENRIQSTNPSERPGLVARITHARSMISDKAWQDLTASLQISESLTGTQNLRQIKKNLGSLIRTGKTSDLDYIGFYRKSFSMTRNAVAFKNVLK